MEDIVDGLSFYALRQERKLIFGLSIRYVTLGSCSVSVRFLS